MEGLNENGRHLSESPLSNKTGTVIVLLLRISEFIADGYTIVKMMSMVKLVKIQFYQLQRIIRILNAFAIIGESITFPYFIFRAAQLRTFDPTSTILS